MKNSSHVAVIGGGWAGMATAVTLANAHIPVTVFETADTLGGRARRVESRGAILDNGLHILLGAYNACVGLIEQVNPGAEVMLRVPLRLELPGQFKLRAPKLPAPWHLLIALWRADGLNLAERYAASRFMVAQRFRQFRAPGNQSVAELLNHFGQPQRARDLLWHPLCVAALNTPPEIADAQVFLNVVRDGLSADRAASDLLLPTTDLSTLFPEPAARYVEARGGTIQRRLMVKGIESREDALFVITEQNVQRFDHVVCAVDPARAPALLAGIDPLRPARNIIDTMTHSPITSIYLQYETHVSLPFPMLALAGAPAQWVFDRGTLMSQRGLLGAVISAASSYHGTEKDKLAAMTHRQLGNIIPALPRPKWHNVITEKRATFACTPGVARPAQRTPVPGLWLAGDYTASDYPGTLEAAVRSGVTCAQGILDRDRGN